MPVRVNKGPYSGDWETNAQANMIGQNLPALRAHDILRGVDLLQARSDVDPGAIRGIARGVKGFWLLLAAATDSGIKGIWLDRTPPGLVLRSITRSRKLVGCGHPRLCAPLGSRRSGERNGIAPGFVDRSDELDTHRRLCRAIVSLPALFRATLQT